MLGPNLLAASVFEESAHTRRMYLPSPLKGERVGEGGDWCDFYSGEWYRGGQEIELDAPLERLPLVVRADGMIPMGKAMKHVGAESDDVRNGWIQIKGIFS
jgi:alpha-glucosidase